MKRTEVSPKELVNVTHKNPVILNSGGPILELEAVEKGMCLVKWIEDGKICRRSLPTACLSRVIPLKESFRHEAGTPKENGR